MMRSTWVKFSLHLLEKSEVTGICHCFNRKSQCFGRVTKPVHSLYPQKGDCPSLLRDLTEEMYFTATPGTTLNWDLFLPCALHALIVTATIFADIFTPIIYRSSPRDKTSPCSTRQRGRQDATLLPVTHRKCLSARDDCSR